VRQLFVGLAVWLLGVFGNQIANLYDIRLGLWCAIVAALIGYCLFVTSKWFKRHVWGNIGRRWPIVTILLWGLLTGLFGSGLAYVLIRQQEQLAATPAAVVLKNGAFEEGLKYWGTGYLEDLIRNGRHPKDEARLPYVVGDPREATVSTVTSGGLDTSKRHSGVASYRFYHTNRRESDRWGSLSQRVNGLTPHAFYVVTFWVSAEGAGEKAFFITTDRKWAQRTYISPGTYAWTSFRHEFNAEDDNVDIRFVIESPCTVWIDDIALAPLKARASVEQLVQLRARGVALRNQLVHSDAQWIKLHHDFEEWERAVVAEMAKIGVRPSDLGYFQTLDLFTPLQFAHAYNELHAKDLRELSEKIRRLAEITQRYDKA
jgi:hypothetical protein